MHTHTSRLTYIRTLPNRDMLAVTHMAISETLSDVATVHDMSCTNPPTHDADCDVTPNEDTDAYEKDDAYKYKSLIRVHTVNARFVGEYYTFWPHQINIEYVKLPYPLMATVSSVVCL